MLLSNYKSGDQESFPEISEDSSELLQIPFQGGFLSFNDIEYLEDKIEEFFETIRLNPHSKAPRHIKFHFGDLDVLPKINDEDIVLLKPLQISLLVSSQGVALVYFSKELDADFAWGTIQYKELVVNEFNFVFCFRKFVKDSLDNAYSQSLLKEYLSEDDLEKLQKLLELTIIDVLSDTKTFQVFFDLDGTLVNTLEDIANSANYTLQQFGHSPRSLEEIQSFIGTGIKPLLQKAFGDYQDQFLETFKQHYLKNIANASQPYPGVVELLQMLKNRNVKLYVWTNKTLEPSIKLLNVLKMNHYFEAVLAGDHVKKPSPDQVLPFVEPSIQSWMVGDSEIDIQAGHNAHMNTCGFLRGFGEVRRLVDQNPDFMFDRFEQLQQYFETKIS